MKIIQETCHNCVISTCRLIAAHNKHNQDKETELETVVFELTGKNYDMFELVQRVGGAVFGTNRDDEIDGNECLITSDYHCHTHFVRIYVSGDGGAATIRLQSNILNPQHIFDKK